MFVFKDFGSMLVWLVGFILIIVVIKVLKVEIKCIMLVDFVFKVGCKCKLIYI